MLFSRATLNADADTFINNTKRPYVRNPKHMNFSFPSFDILRVAMLIHVCFTYKYIVAELHAFVSSDALYVS